MNGFEHVLTAVQSIAQNKVRAFLTTLGVIIGVMSVILLVAFGESAQAYVEREFAVMGSNVLIVTPGRQETTGLIPITAGSHRKLTYDIAKAIRRRGEGITGVAGNSVGLAGVKYRNRQRHVMCIGTTPDFDNIRELPHGGRH
jgi:putative ABC transport system permease protein